MYLSVGKQQGVNNLPIVVVIESKKMKDKGLTESFKTTATSDMEVTSLSPDGKESIQKIKKCTEIQVVEISFDVSTHSSETDLMDTVAHEFTHATDAIKMGPENYKKYIDSNSNASESSARNVADKVLHELPGKKK